MVQNKKITIIKQIPEWLNVRETVIKNLYISCVKFRNKFFSQFEDNLEQIATTKKSLFLPQENK